MFQISSDLEEKELYSLWESSVMVITEAQGKDRPLAARYGLCQEPPSFFS